MKIKSMILLSIIGTAIACNHRAQTNKNTVDTTIFSPMNIQSDQHLDGVWMLQELSENKTPFKILFPSKTPFLKLDLATKVVSGNTSCNSFSGKTNVKEDKISFEQPMAMTQRFCPGDGEPAFLQDLQRVRNFKLIADTSLHLYSGDTLLMKFYKTATLSN